MKHLFYFVSLDINIRIYFIYKIFVILKMSSTYNVINTVTKMLDNCHQITIENMNNKEIIKNLKNAIQTRSTKNKINEYRILIRKNTFEYIRIVTEIYYYINEYGDELLQDTEFYNMFTKKTDILKNNINTIELLYSSTNEEKMIIKAYKDELSRSEILMTELTTITNICLKYDPNLLAMAKKDIHISKYRDFKRINIEKICDFIHIDLNPNFIEINVLLIIANYLLDNSYLNLYKDFIFNCPTKFLKTYMNNSETTPQLLMNLKKYKMYYVIEFLVDYIHDTKIKTWCERYNNKL